MFVSLALVFLSHFKVNYKDCDPSLLITQAYTFLGIMNFYYHHKSFITPKKISTLLIYGIQLMCKSPSLFPKYKILWLFTQDPF